MILNFINGQYREGRSGRNFDAINPVDGSVITQVSEASRDDVGEAVAAARAALNGPWGQMKLAQRCDMLYAIADEIDRRAADFLAAEIADTGKPYALASHLDIPRGAANFKIFTDTIKNVSTESFEMRNLDG